MGTEKRLLGYLAQLRERLQCGELSVVAHVPGNVNIADAFTKESSPLLDWLCEAVMTGWLDLRTEKGEWARGALSAKLSNKSLQASVTSSFNMAD